MNLKDIAAALQLSVADNIPLTGVTIDSRKVQPGNLFIAIKGERHDGHDYLLAAANQGATAVLCQQRVAGVQIPQLLVPNTLQALADIAKAYRQTLAPRVIALTGSNGKTTVKEMIYAMLPEPKYATRGNLNNHIGVPLCVLSLNSLHKYAVFELGANQPGDIAYTVPLVQPDVTLINNIGPAHIAGFGSIDGVARAKGEIHQCLSVEGTAILNDDDAYAHFWDDILQQRRVLRFSAKRPADVYAQHACMRTDGCMQFDLVTPRARAPVTLAVRGSHHLHNALAASACAYALGVSITEIVQGLASFQGVAGRAVFRPGLKQATIIDDTYNANLSSSLTAIEVLASCQGRRILVFGDMAELGSHSPAHHRAVGLAAKQHGIETVMTVGVDSYQTTEAFAADGHHFDTQQELVTALLHQLDSHTTILVKGSRSSAMEKIVQQLVIS